MIEALSNKNSFLYSATLLKAIMLSLLAALAVQHVSNAEGFNVSAIYGGAFNLLSILAGFLATFYVFVATRSNNFLDAIKKTSSFKILLSLLRATILATLIVVGFTYAMSILEPKNFTFPSLIFCLVLIWSSSVMLIIINFYRCAKIFFGFVEGS